MEEVSYDEVMRWSAERALVLAGDIITGKTFSKDNPTNDIQERLAQTLLLANHFQAFLMNYHPNQSIQKDWINLPFKKEANE